MNAVRNPALMLAIGLPTVAVLASVLTLFIALRHPDAQLPEQYHWEGFQLDRDFSRAQRASELQVRSVIDRLNVTGTCELRLRTTGAAADALTLMLAHGTKPALDREVIFKRVSAASEVNGKAALYRGQCEAAPEGRWRLELADSVNGWAIRANVGGSLEQVTLDASPGNKG